MTEPYRSGVVCPRCGEAAVDARDGHLVCDACDGMLIGADEVASAIHDIDDADATPALREPQPATSACPRCATAMQTVTLAFGTHVLGGGFLSCAQHGVWMPREALVAAYAMAGQRARAAREKTGGSHYAPVMSSSLQGGSKGFDRGRSGPPPGAGMVAVIQPTNSNPFAHGGELAISGWERPYPMVHTLFVSKYRGYRMRCAACGGNPLEFEADRWVCTRCKGSFVENAALVAMISGMTGELFELPAETGSPRERACPVCATTMIATQLEGVAIERCADHGVWFHDHALAAALQHAAEPGAKPSWLHRLFHR
jgi:ribosomal protein S27AE